MDNIENWLEDRLSLLECVYKSGNLGALNDVVYYCNEHHRPLPEWAVMALTKAIYGLSIGDKETPKKWAAWYRRHKQDMSDYENYDNVIDAREHGSTLEKAWDIAAHLTHGYSLDAKHSTRGAYYRVIRTMKTESHRYFLLKTFPIASKCRKIPSNIWVFIKNTIKSIKRNNNKTKDL